jgi:hypothetical protein
MITQEKCSLNFSNLFLQLREVRLQCSVSLSALHEWGVQQVQMPVVYTPSDRKSQLDLIMWCLHCSSRSLLVYCGLLTMSIQHFD